MIRDDQFDRLFRDKERQHNIQISHSARALIILCIRSIYEDPHPSWRQSEPELEDTSRQIMEYYLPKYIDVVSDGAAGSHGKHRIVTFFDALHWIGENLSGINPFGTK